MYLPNLDDVQEPQPVEDGFYEVEIIAARLQESEKGERISAQLTILGPLPEDNPRPPFLFHTLFLPVPGQEQWKIDGSKLQMKRFFTLFGIEVPESEEGLTDEETADWLETWSGKRAKVKVKKNFSERLDRWENVLSVPTLAKRSAAPAPAAASGIRMV